MTELTRPYPSVDGTQPCASEDPELFFPGTSSRQNYFAIDRARALCASCPFRRDCLAYALTHTVDGIWAGTTASERAALRRQHSIQAEPVHLDIDGPSDPSLIDRGGRQQLKSPCASASRVAPSSDTEPEGESKHEHRH